MKYGRYEVLSELGRGSMGMVFQAHDPQIDRLIALKVLREDRLTSEDYVKRFLKEATAVGRLSHPGIVTVYDVGQDHGTIYIAMEFLQGQPLDTLSKNRACAQEDIIRIGIQAAEALHYAHERGIVHRDIKPPNIICDQAMRVKITDFGIAHIDDPEGQQMTRAGEILGTPVYMAPEQVLGQQVDGRSDIYSLGVILYELSTGQRPFQGESLASLFQAITLNDPVTPDQLNHELSSALCQVIMKAMAREPEGRFATGQALADQLALCLARREPGPLFGQKTPAAPRQRRSGLGLFLLLALLIAGGGLAAYHYHYLWWPLVSEVFEVAEEKQEADISVPAVSPPEADQQTGQALPEREIEGIPEVGPEVESELELESQRSTGPALSDLSEGQEEGSPDAQSATERSNRDASKIITVQPDGRKRPVQRATREEPEAYDRLLDEILSEEKPQPLDIPPEEDVPPAAAGTPPRTPVTQPSVPSEQPARPTQDDSLLDEILSEDKPKPPKPVAQPAEQKPPITEQPSRAPTKDRMESASSSKDKKKKDPAKKRALLTIKSRPAKAKLYLDGEYKGETPVELRVLAAKHEVVLELPGHLDWKAQLDLSKGEDLSVSPRLAPE